MFVTYYASRLHISSQFLLVSGKSSLHPFSYMFRSPTSIPTGTQLRQHLNPTQTMKCNRMGYTFNNTVVCQSYKKKAAFKVLLLPPTIKFKLNEEPKLN